MRNLPSLITGALMLIIGCTSQPEPLSLEEIPDKMAAAFAPAKLHVKKTSDAVIQMVKDKQFPGAAMQLQALLGNTTLTKDQRNVVSQSLMTVNLILAEQASSASPPSSTTETTTSATSSAVPPTTSEEAATAAAVLEHHRRTK